MDSIFNINPSKIHYYKFGLLICTQIFHGHQKNILFDTMFILTVMYVKENSLVSYVEEIRKNIKKYGFLFTYEKSSLSFVDGLQTSKKLFLDDVQ